MRGGARGVREFLRSSWCLRLVHPVCVTVLVCQGHVVPPFHRPLEVSDRPHSEDHRLHDHPPPLFFSLKVIYPAVV